MATNAQNVSSHQQFWFSGVYSYNKEKLNIVSEGSYRNDNWFQHTRQFLIREMFFYSQPTFDVGGGCVVSWQYPYQEVKPVFELRPSLEGKMNYQTSHPNISFIFRFRYEMRFFQSMNSFSSPIHRGRLQAKCNIFLNPSSDIIISNEIMLQNDAGPFKFQTNRFYVGWHKKWGNIKFNMGIMFQWIDRRNKNYDADFIAPIKISN